jgi:hypothetical protein
MPTIYPSPGGHDGYIDHSTTNWTTVHDATTGTTADSSATSTKQSIGAWCTVAGRTVTYYIRRSYLIFSTSGISLAPSAATLKIYGYSSTSGDVIAIEGTWVGAGSFATGDYDSFTGYASGWDDGDVTAYSSEVSTWSTSGYNDFTLNATALAKMASLYQDVSARQLGSCNTEQNGMYWVDNSTLGLRPYIDYTSAGYANDPLGQDMDDKTYKVIGVSSEDISKVSGA